jgi:hypothetical protein
VQGFTQSERRVATVIIGLLKRAQDVISVDAAIQGTTPETVLIRGGSCIVDPLGSVLAEPVFGEETILMAELDRRLIARAKFDLDVVGHYARPDLFHLSVNRHELEAVAFDRDSAENNRSHGCLGGKRSSSDTGERPRQ